jgi:hypothetical protein
MVEDFGSLYDILVGIPPDGRAELKPETAHIGDAEIRAKPSGSKER